MKRLAFLFVLFVSPAAHADVVVVLNDAARSVLISTIAAGLQAQPQLSPQATFLLNLINTAPVMTGSKEIQPDQPKAAEPKKEETP